MSTESAPVVSPQPPVAPRLPVLALALMAVTGFIVIMTETLPAGLLPQLSAYFEISEGAAGQLVSAYALAWIHRLGSGAVWVVTPKCPVVVEE